MPTIVKLDIENGEYYALRGAEDIIRKGRPKIIMEVGDLGRTEANSTNMCADFLAKRGYGFYRGDVETGQIESVRQAEFSGGRGVTIRGGIDNLMCVYER